MRCCRDYQQSKVYAWEAGVINPRTSRQVAFKDAQAFVDGIFICEGLLYPPCVTLLHPNTKRWAGLGSRQEIQIKPVTTVGTLLHEIAHVLTMEIDRSQVGHGPDFVGVYMRLLDKYAGVPLALTMYSLQNTGIEYNLAAQYRCVDQGYRRRA